jgi:hypothetical protein
LVLLNCVVFVCILVWLHNVAVKQNHFYNFVAFIEICYNINIVKVYLEHTDKVVYNKVYRYILVCL